MECVCGVGGGGGVGRESQQELLCQIFRRIKSL